MSLVPIIFFLAGRLCCRANVIFAAGLTLRGHEADLINYFFSFLFLTGFISDAIQFKHFHMSIKKSQAILKCFIDLKSSVWFTLGSEDETMFCDTCKTLVLARPPVKVFKTLSDRQSYIFRKFQKSKKSS